MGCDDRKSPDLAAKAESYIQLGLLQPRPLQAEPRQCASCIPTLSWVVSRRGLLLRSERCIMTCMIKAFGLKAHAHKCGFVHIIRFTAILD